MEYFDWEEFNEEDIYDEGFILYDDFNWEGLFFGIWIKEIFIKFVGIIWRRKFVVSDDGFEFIIRL